MGPEPLSFEEARYNALPDAKKEARAKAASALAVHASGQLSARKDAASLLEALKVCTDEGVGGDVEDELRKAIGDAPLAEGALLVKDGESLWRRYCSLVI